MIIFRGKGILMIVYFIVSAIGILFINRLLIENLGFYKSLSIESLIGLIVILTGLWTKVTAEDYYVDKKGKKVSLDIVNDFFFIKMSVWGIILPIIGIGIIAYGLIL
ncbi:hypothetical protein [Fulvivirga sediminis]|uniref:Uncharacterized protein n=1 Tax=Fulvivirga sediminis TaxID=2803949 RepID=A0A937K328_9BACT|nr:hypothetical protein [Fulvivirga sediminis]MBL3658975.1 hypothetical protein [Fulvivirga sediminis]